MTTKEYLRKYQALCGEIKRDQERLEQIEASLQKSIQFDGIPKGMSAGNPTQNVAIKLATIRSHLQAKLIEAELSRQIIADEIERMSTPVYKELIYSRYILLLTWEAVTDRVSERRKERYDSKHVMTYMHSQALKEFERLKGE